MDWRPLVEERIANVGVPLVLGYNDFWRLEFFHVLGSLQTSLLCIVGELAGEGSAAVAVGVSDV